MKKISLAICGAIFAASSAFAAGPYVNLDGMYSMTRVKNTTTIGSTTDSDKSYNLKGMGGDLSLGYAFNNNISADITGVMNRSKSSKNNALRTTNDFSAVLAGVYYSMPAGMIDPYVGIRVGYGQRKGKVTDTATGTSINFTKRSGLAGGAVVGGLISLSQDVKINLGYSATMLSVKSSKNNATATNGADSVVSKDGKINHGFILGLRFSF